MPVVLVQVNTADSAEAARIGRAMVEAGLAAAANVIPEISSIYRWQGEIKESSEAMLVLKVSADRTGEVIERVRVLHSYECPAILALPVADGDPDYLAWVARETGGAP
jgi:periplasmic divalent cation tolerance protein